MRIVSILHEPALLCLLAFRLILLDSGCLESSRTGNELNEQEEIQTESAPTPSMDTIARKPVNGIADLYSQVKSSVFFVLTETEDEIHQGTAFTIDHYGLAISNEHVFKDADFATIYDENGDKYSITEIIERDPELDYIIFRIGNDNDFPFLKISNEIPRVGEDCFTVGNPKGLMQTFSKGYVSNIWQNEIQNTTEITHGSSGGPLFDSQGRVIGITTSGKGEANINFALRIDRIPLHKYINNISTHLMNDPLAEVKIIESDQESNNRLKQDYIQERIENYYTAFADEEWEEVKSFYAPKMKRYYGVLNLEKDEAISVALKQNDNLQISKTITLIREESFSMKQLSNGNTLVDFIAEIAIYKIGNNPVEYHNISTIVELNPAFAFVSIYDKNIIGE